MAIDNPSESQRQALKNSAWQEMAVRIDAITDEPGTPIDPGIKDAVIALNLLGITTIGSCEGHLDHSHNSSSPYVQIAVPEDQALLQKRTQVYNAMLKAEQANDWESYGNLGREAFRLADEALLPTLKLGRKTMVLIDEYYTDKQVPSLQRIVVCRISHVLQMECQGSIFQLAADPEERATNLALDQRLMQEFTDFLKQKYFES